MTVDKKTAANSTLWSLVENGGLALISLASLVIYTRMLSTSDFGLFAIVLALIELFGLFVTMLFHDVLVQRQEATDLHFDTAFTTSLAASAFLMLACCALSPTFATLVDEPEAGSVLCWMSLCFPTAALSATIVPRERRNFSFRTLAIRSVIGRLSGALGGIVLVALGAGIWGLVAQQVLMRLIGSLVLWFSSDSHPRLGFAFREFKDLFKFGMYALGALFVGFSLKRLFTVLTGLFLGVELAGYLNLSMRAIDVFWSIAATATTQVALPMLSSLQADLPRLRHAYTVATSYVCVVLYSCFGGIALIAPELVELLFGAKWLPSAPYISVLGFLVLVQAPRLLVGPVLTALGKPQELLLGKIAELAFVLIAIFVTQTPTLEVAVGIWVLRELIGLPITIWMLRNAVHQGAIEQFRGTVTALLSTLIMALVVLAVRYWLPATVHLAWRTGLLVTSGGLAFLVAIRLLDRPLVKSLIEFGAAAVSRKLTARSASAATALPPAAHKTPAAP